MLRLKVDTQRFIIDRLEGETIVIDSVDGRLFLFEGDSAEVWNAICAGPARDAVIGMAGNDQTGIVADFVARLEAIGLVQESGETANDVALPSLNNLTVLDVTQYDDMSSIITMDPIHDIDPEKGWPHKADG